MACINLYVQNAELTTISSRLIGSSSIQVCQKLVLCRNLTSVCPAARTLSTQSGCNPLDQGLKVVYACTRYLHQGARHGSVLTHHVWDEGLHVIHEGAGLVLRIQEWNDVVEVADFLHNVPIHLIINPVISLEDSLVGGIGNVQVRHDCDVGGVVHAGVGSLPGFPLPLQLEDWDVDGGDPGLIGDAVDVGLDNSELYINVGLRSTSTFATQRLSGSGQMGPHAVNLTGKRRCASTLELTKSTWVGHTYIS